MVEEKEDLTRKILPVCASCSHAKWQGGTLTCDRKKSECHSKRVRRWLDEIRRLEDSVKEPIRTPPTSFVGKFPLLDGSIDLIPASVEEGE